MLARRRIAVVGFIATAVTFGPGRMAYGMFLPQLRETFGFGTGTAGTIAGLGFAAFFAALFATGWMTARLSPRLPLLIGGASAALGFVLTALAPDLVTLALGIALASASAGFAWTPFNSMAQQAVDEHHQKRALSIVSTGTTFGIVAAGLLASVLVLFGQSWRIAWWCFGASALVVVIAPLVLLPANALAVKRLDDGIGTILARLRSREAVPLYGAALSFGATNGTYLSYWIDHIASSGGLPGLGAGLIGPVLLTAFGLAGTIGLLTADVEDRIGLAPLLSALFAASGLSLLLLAFFPGSWAGALVSAALQGACLMALSSVYSFWSERLFPSLVSTSFTAVLMVYAAGNMLAPPLAGRVAGAIGLGPTLAGFGLVSLATLPLVLRVRSV